jgi:hypothetical protein
MANVNERFDLIYLDACGPLLGGKPKSLLPILVAFERERLSSLGALLTTFTEPPEEQAELYATIMASFFSPRYKDVPEALFRSGMDPAVAEHDLKHGYFHILRNLTDTYSDFATRLVVDLGRSIIPLARVANIDHVSRAFFAQNADIKKAVALTMGVRARTAEEEALNSPYDILDRAGAALSSPASYPLLHFFRTTSKDPKAKACLEWMTKFPVASSSLESGFMKSSVLSNLIQSAPGIASEAVKRAVYRAWFDSGGGLFCDTPYPHLLLNSLLGVYGRPYFFNPRSTMRLRYRAKERDMFSDAILFDQCRSHFDLFPSLQLMPSVFKSTATQLLLRVGLDRIHRHDWGSESQLFGGAALASQGEHAAAGFYSMPPREVVEGDVGMASAEA